MSDALIARAQMVLFLEVQQTSSWSDIGYFKPQRIRYLYYLLLDTRQLLPSAHGRGVGTA